LRPTTRDLADAHEDLEVLAYAHDPNGSPRLNSGFPDLAKMLNLMAWAVGEIRSARVAAAYGPGVEGGYHTLQQAGSHGDLEARRAWADAYGRAVSNLLAGWAVEVGRIRDEWQQEGIDVGRYPTRTELSEAF
jgi:hypothetical protein